MEVEIARDLDEAVAMAAAHPEADLLAGGTDLMVEINFGRRRPERVIVLDRVSELKHVTTSGGVRLGAGVTYSWILTGDAGSIALREAARSVGSPQIRNTGTVGGNLGTGSPAGDTLPVLAALGATVVLRSATVERRVAFSAFLTGPKRTVRRPGEVIVGAEWDDAGPAQTFLKVGARNAMVISVASLALVIDRARRRVGIGLGSCGPTIIVPEDAVRFAVDICDEAGWERPFAPSEATCRAFGAKVAAAARPIDDVRGTAAYRTEVLGVLAARALARVAAVAG